MELDSEDMLRKANTKFIKRFKKIESQLAINGKDFSEATLEEMDEIWERTKYDDQ